MRIIWPDSEGFAGQELRRAGVRGRWRLAEPRSAGSQTGQPGGTAGSRPLPQAAPLLPRRPALRSGPKARAPAPPRSRNSEFPLKSGSPFTQAPFLVIPAEWVSGEPDSHTPGPCGAGAFARVRSATCGPIVGPLTAEGLVQQRAPEANLRLVRTWM